MLVASRKAGVSWDVYIECKIADCKQMQAVLELAKGVHPLLEQLPECSSRFADDVCSYILDNDTLDEAYRTLLRYTADWAQTEDSVFAAVLNLPIVQQAQASRKEASHASN
jgi:hypothetical protein